MPKGDIVLINFPFTDLSGSKLRPAVILADTALDFTVCFITTQLQWEETNSDNIGLNVGLLKNRIQLEFDFYVKILGVIKFEIFSHRSNFC